MTADAENTATLWKRLRSDRIVMLGLETGAPTALRPMTTQLDSEGIRGRSGSSLRSTPGSCKG